MSEAETKKVLHALQKKAGWSVAEGSVKAVAILMISIGGKLLSEREYELGLILVIVGWIILVVNYFVKV